jgi:succinate dehydrogenase/fumarate reductase flavoprotein subunit
MTERNGPGTGDGSTHDESVERREFLVKAGFGLAAAGVGGAALAAAAGSSTAQAASPVGGPVHWDYDVDIVVAGAGNGGMSAALAAAVAGAKTLVLEISTQIGGNTLMSGGILHTAGCRTWEEYNKFSFGLHDQVLGKVFVETFWNEYVPWLQTQGAYFSRPTPEVPGYYGDYHLGHGEPGQLRHKLYFDSLVKRFESAGGTILRKTRVVKIYADSEGRVIGVRAKTWRDSPRDEDQHWINVRAKKTIMAIGGWIMDGEKKQKYLGQDGYFGQHMCGPFSSGEGIELCQAVGAGLSKTGWSSFSGGPYANSPDCC